MRLLLLTFYFPPDLSAGSFRANALVEALLGQATTPIHIDIVTSMPNRYHSLESSAPAYEEGDGFTIRRIPLPAHQSGMADQTKAFLAYARAVLREFRRHDWDGVVATSSRLMTATLAAWVSRRGSTPIYLDIRDLFTDTMADLLANSPLRSLLPPLRWVERWTLRSASRVNVVSPGFLEHARQVAPGHNYRVFTNGIDDDFLRLDFTGSGTDRRPLPLMVYAGNIGAGQGLHNVLPEAAKLLCGKVRFRVIGDGGMRRVLKQRLAELGTSNVEVLDPVPRTDLYAHYREADVLFLHLNHHGAFRRVLPSKLFEYAATGKLILAGVAGYAADFLRQEVAGAAVFEPCDAVGMAAAAERLLAIEGPVDRAEFRVRFARKRIMKRMAKDVLDMLVERDE